MRAIAILATIAVAACSEVKDERYADYETARLAGAIKRGWIPAFVPQDAYALHDIHDLDSNAQTLSFRLPTSQIPEMVRAMTLAEDAATAERVVRAAGWTESPAPVVVYAVCAQERSGALVVNERTGAAFYQAPVAWPSDPCSAG
ncbi:MAG: hypothetical protein EON91_06015 [Brevundimonas sp.]|uniref:hypothetical protein n=1 Tax=Brevundimonas sp. TaxID=1871086 RepID=UPI0011F78F68|nr:hypothetical protein [Brevundimonas sp.]RZJ18236.1 MAG: hypothetical protein EON91_06015 [Brevundimonas sp.]